MKNQTTRRSSTAKPVSQVDAILTARTKTHGVFTSHAAMAQALKRAMREDTEGQTTEAWHALDDDMAEALDMNQCKVARILNGDPTHIDHWDDIAGYATLVADRLRKETPSA